MTTTIRPASFLVNQILGVKPIYSLAKTKARNMMLKRAKKIGIPWQENVKQLQQHNWEEELALQKNPDLTYPEYYLRAFHAYEQGNLSWDAALEVESIAKVVHSTIWGEANINGDAKLRTSYHDIVRPLVGQPHDILDLGCSVGMSTFALQDVFPKANLTGLDLSPYFLAVANYRSSQKQAQVNWIHAAAEKTNLPDASFDLVSAFLLFHELPSSAAIAIFQEARRLLRSGGHFTMMDMNPQSEAYKKMPPYVFTLLKSTEPYLDEYFTLDVEAQLKMSGFAQVTIVPNSPRHRTIVAVAE